MGSTTAAPATAIASLRPAAIADRSPIDLRDDQTRRCSAGTCAVDGSAVGTVGGHQTMAKERVVGAESGVDSPLSACAFSSVASYEIGRAHV